MIFVKNIENFGKEKKKYGTLKNAKAGIVPILQLYKAKLFIFSFSAY